MEHSKAATILANALVLRKGFGSQKGNYEQREKHTGCRQRSLEYSLVQNAWRTDSNRQKI